MVLVENFDQIRRRRGFILVRMVAVLLITELVVAVLSGRGTVR